MLKYVMCMILPMGIIFSAYAELSFRLNEVGCNTVKGKLVSKKLNQEQIGVYINDTLMKSIEADDVNVAFAYNDLPYKKDKLKLIEKLLITYNATDCITENTQARCSKYVMIDLTSDKVLFSEAFYPPVVNSMLLNVKWGEKP